MTSPNISERIAGLARQVQADPTNIGVLSTGEACAVALLLNVSICWTIASTRSTLWSGSGRTGKRPCATCIGRRASFKRFLPFHNGSILLRRSKPRPAWCVKEFLDPKKPRPATLMRSCRKAPALPAVNSLFCFYFHL
jgi:hypothetical protein